MRVGGKYSHLNGEEYLLVHRPDLWQEVQEVISEVDASACRNKVSKEHTMRGKLLFSPTDMNRAFKQVLQARGWVDRRISFGVTADEKILRGIYDKTETQQRDATREAGCEPIMSYNQTDFLKERVAIEVQFGKYAFVAHDLFVKHLSFYVSDIIDVGIVVLPMKDLKWEVSYGVPCYERDLLNIIRQGRGVPAVPLVLIGVVP